MNRSLAQTMDRLFIALVLRKRRSFERRESQCGLAQGAEKLFNEPRLFYLPFGNRQPKLLISTLAASYKKGHRYKLCFDSPFTTPWPENDLLHATYYRSENESSPHLVILHGYQDSRNIFHRWLGRSLLESRVSSLVMELPYHMRRAPRGTFSGEYFVYRGVGGMLQAIRQAVAEACALVTWLKGNGCERVGIMGSSLGGLIAALSCAVEPEIDFCILNVPALDLVDLIERSLAAKPVRGALERDDEESMRSLEALAGILTPRLLKPLLGQDDILAIQAMHDLFVPSEQVTFLRESWGEFRVIKLPQGHISAFLFAGGTILKEAAAFTHPS